MVNINPNDRAVEREIQSQAAEHGEATPAKPGRSIANRIAGVGLAVTTALGAVGCDDPNAFDNPSQSQVENIAEDLQVTLERRYMTGGNVGNANAQAIVDGIVQSVLTNSSEHVEEATEHLRRRIEIDARSRAAAEQIRQELEESGRRISDELFEEILEGIHLLRTGFNVQQR